MSRTQLSPARRRADRAALDDEVVDVLVIGGGVTGAGAALDAASRGLSVALLEARDFAAGTSSRSSKLIHGGLRYLEQFAFPLVHEALSERARLVQTIAPHLVTPLPFLLPLTAPVWQRAYYGAGVALYDVLGAAFTQRAGRSRATGTCPARPRWRRSPGCAATSSAARSATGTPRSTTPGTRWPSSAPPPATAPGCSPAPGSPGCSATATGDVRRPVVGVRAADLTDGSSFTVRARSVIAATGVWSDDIGAMLGVSAPSLQGARVQGRAPGRAALGDRRRRPGRRRRAAGRADPPDADERAVRHPVGRALDRRHHRHPVAAGPRPPGRLQRRHRLHPRPGQPGARPAGDRRTRSSASTPACGRCWPGSPTRPAGSPASTPSSRPCPGSCWWPAASTRPTG